MSGLRIGSWRGVGVRAAARRGAFVLVAVLLLIVMGSLVAASVLANTSAMAQRNRAASDATRAQVVVASASNALKLMLAEQRDSMLKGQPPELPERIVLFEADGERAVVRLIPRNGAALRATAARLDVNVATEAQLRAIPDLDPAVVDAIIAARDRRPLLALEELAGEPGITPEVLYGDAERFIAAIQPELARQSDRNADPLGLSTLSARESLGPAFVDLPDEEEDNNDGPTTGARTSAGPAGLGGGAGVLALVDLFTTYAAEPNVQVGLNPERASAEAFGRNRINLNREFADDLAEQIRNELDENAVNVVRALLEQQEIVFDTDSVIVETLMLFGLPPADWRSILDMFASTPDPFLLNRIDVGLAPEPVLRTIPGFDRERAILAVETREQMEADGFLSPVWLVLEDVLTQELYQQAAPFLATRSLQYELLIETGYERISEVGSERIGMSTPGRGAGPTGGDERAMAMEDVFGEREPTLRARRVTELVIDLAAPNPRIASIRDMSHLPLAIALWSAERAEVMDTVEIERSTQADLDAVVAALDGDEPTDGPGSGGGDGFGAPGTFFGEGASDFGPPRSARPAGAPSGSSGSGPPSDSEGDAASDSSDEASPAPPGVDRRSGRWRVVRPSLRDG